MDTSGRCTRYAVRDTLYALRRTLYAGNRSGVLRRACGVGLGFALVLLACSAKYLANGTIDPGFNTNKTYKVAVMPFLVRGLQTPGAFERDMAYGHLVRRLMETGKLMPMDKATVDAAVRVQEFGQQGTVDPALARSIGQELGADLVCLAELSYEQVEPKVVLTATVQLHGVNSTAVVYSGLGRMANPLSPNAAAELALDYATEKLVARMR